MYPLQPIDLIVVSMCFRRRRGGFRGRCPGRDLLVGRGL